MLVVLRMNKVFMGFMRQNYPEVIESVHAKYASQRTVPARHVVDVATRARIQEGRIRGRHVRVD